MWSSVGILSIYCSVLDQNGKGIGGRSAGKAVDGREVPKGKEQRVAKYARRKKKEQACAGRGSVGRLSKAFGEIDPYNAKETIQFTS